MKCRWTSLGRDEYQLYIRVKGISWIQINTGNMPTIIINRAELASRTDVMAFATRCVEFIEADTVSVNFEESPINSWVVGIAFQAEAFENLAYAKQTVSNFLDKWYETLK